jgi:hypothetical protein
MDTSPRTGFALMFLTAVITACLALFLFGCATGSPASAPAAAFRPLCLDYPSGLTEIGEHATLWCGELAEH